MRRCLEHLLSLHTSSADRQLIHEGKPCRIFNVGGSLRVIAVYGYLYPTYRQAKGRRDNRVPCFVIGCPKAVLMGHVAPVPPSVDFGGPLHYETMIQRICTQYTQR
jgi:hypothetical protein